MRSTRSSAAGPRRSTEAGTEQKTESITAHTRQSKVFICTLAAEVLSNRSAIQIGMPGARTMEFATVVARGKARDSPLHKAGGQVMTVSRVGSKK
jgi:hypothetical protein